ncbi:MAG: RsmB/NOP family class I SAM-dependent RNA methyltransferase [Sphingomonadaceae bacterium]|nr:RsmB/NOP family class I SAM-dependent RNA methyltransferase [Sphingomonadaceae bacterium]
MSTSEPKGTASRRAALRLLESVLRRGRSIEAEASAACSNLARDDDRRLAIAIASEVLRRLPDYDALIDSKTKKNLPDDAKARMVLRLALAQALALGTPHHAAIATALPLLQGGSRRLAHGVFGALMRSEAVLPETPTLPDAVAIRWSDHWGEAMVEAAARAISAPPPLDLTMKSAAKPEALEGLSLLSGHIRLPRQSVMEVPGFDAGDWWVQDIAASIPARLLGPGDGKTALDLCAAPGGKTLQLAAQGWQVTAVDMAESRLARLSENLDRTGLSAKTVIGDVLQWQPDEPADAVLLDAPCSATGIFRRHPDVLHRAGARIIASCAEAQRAMLARAAGWVKPGGRLVYAVCSLEPEEGEAMATAFLDDQDEFVIEPPDADDLPAGIAPAQKGWLRILPGMIDDPGGADGFFISHFRRR